MTSMHLWIIPDTNSPLSVHCRNYHNATDASRVRNINTKLIDVILYASFSCSFLVTSGIAQVSHQIYLSPHTVFKFHLLKASELLSITTFSKWWMSVDTWWPIVSCTVITNAKKHDSNCFSSQVVLCHRRYGLAQKHWGSSLWLSYWVLPESPYSIQLYCALVIEWQGNQVF